MSTLLSRCRLLAALAVCLALPPAVPAEPVAAEPPRAELTPREKVVQLRPGMTAREVRELLGQPRHIARQILYARYLEQWTYDEPLNVRIEFDWRKGQERQILAVQPLSTPPR
jgi:hypothetical protein